MMATFFAEDLTPSVAVRKNKTMHKWDRGEPEANVSDECARHYSEQEVTPQIMRELERVILLKNVDTKWENHIDAMDELKKGIGLRSMGQKDPVVEYRFEGFAMFDEMIASIREDTVRMLLTVKVRIEEPPKPEQVLKPAPTAPTAPVVKSGTNKKVGRNDPCPCGSGKKYKKCCGANE